MTPAMPIDETPTPAGRVEISDSAIIAVIHEAVLGSYGVVDLGSRAFQSPILRRLRRNDPGREM